MHWGAQKHCIQGMSWPFLIHKEFYCVGIFPIPSFSRIGMRQKCANRNERRHNFRERRIPKFFSVEFDVWIFGCYCDGCELQGFQGFRSWCCLGQLKWRYTHPTSHLRCFLGFRICCFLLTHAVCMLRRCHEARSRQDAPSRIFCLYRMCPILLASNSVFVFSVYEA